MSWYVKAVGKDKAAVQRAVQKQFESQKHYGTNKDSVPMAMRIAYTIIDGFPVSPSHAIEFSANGHYDGGVGNMSFDIKAVPLSMLADLAGQDG